MKIEEFKLERWMTTYELDVRYDIAESGIAPMSVNDLLDLFPEAERESALQRLLDLRLGYSEARGSAALRSALAATYCRHVAREHPDHHRRHRGELPALQHAGG